MEKLYNDLSSDTGLASAKRLYQHVQKKTADDFLKTQDSYTLHKPVIRNFRRRKYTVKGLNDLVQMDLADMTSLSRWNGGIKFLLVWIDCYSRYLRVEPLKTKSAQVVAAAISKLLNEQKPKHVQSDKGTEFLNANVRELFQEADVNFYTTQDPDTKAAFAERVIRTLKSKIYRYLTLKNTKNYINVLPQLVLSYNRSKHRSTGQRPVDITTNSLNVGTLQQIEVKHKLKVGDKVRIALEKSAFSKGYTPNWSKEVFLISNQLQTDPPTYRIKDANGEEILGSYYEPELQAV